MPSHLQTATIQAAILNITSSILAQLLTLYRSSALGAKSSALNPLGLDFVAILQYLITCLILTPPNFLWQEYLEKTFPGFPIQKGKQKMKVDEDGNVRVAAIAFTVKWLTLRQGVFEEQRLNKKNTAIKFTLDQTVGATVNNIMFLGLISALRGKSLFGCFEKISEVSPACDQSTDLGKEVNSQCIQVSWGMLCYLADVSPAHP